MKYLQVNTVHCLNLISKYWCRELRGGSRQANSKQCSLPLSLTPQLPRGEMSQHPSVLPITPGITFQLSKAEWEA